MHPLYTTVDHPLCGFFVGRKTDHTKDSDHTKRDHTKDGGQYLLLMIVKFKQCSFFTHFFKKCKSFWITQVLKLGALESGNARKLENPVLDTLENITRQFLDFDSTRSPDQNMNFTSDISKVLNKCWLNVSKGLIKCD